MTAVDEAAPAPARPPADRSTRRSAGWPPAAVLRRSVGLPALPAVVGLVTANTFARRLNWRHEWLWAFYDYQFATVLLGPVVAGLAAWEGMRAARARSLVEGSERGVSGPAVWAAALAGWVLAGYLVGLAEVVVAVRLAGTPSAPGWAALSTAGPAVALLLAEIAAGFAIGWRAAASWTPPLVAVGCFLLVLLLYTRGPVAAVRVGGASGSLLGLAPRPDVQGAQMLLYTSVAASALATLTRSAYRAARRIAVQAAVALLVVATVAVLVHRDGGELRAVPSDVECKAFEITICLGPGYVSRMDHVHERIAPYATLMASAAGRVPTRFDQSVQPGDPDAAALPAELVLGADSLAAGAVLSWYIPAGCDLYQRPEFMDAYLGLQYWLDTSPDDGRFEDPTVPTILRTGTDAQRLDWAREAAGLLRGCTG